MRKAEIDLDWLDAEIEEYKRTINEELVSDNIASMYNLILTTLISVRSKCEPIEEPIREGFSPPSGIITKAELPAKCLLDWESAKYCHNNNECQMCKINN